MSYLNIDKKTLEKNGAIHTAREIAGQPVLWRAIYDKILAEQEEIYFFMKSTLAVADKIILTGAGTSGYIGHSIEGSIQLKSKVTTVSIPTTHLVSHPQDYYDPETPTLVISFARSGNSPESVAAAQLADKYIKKCHHLIITCNPDGNLARHKFKNGTHVVVLPSQADDKSLAMTGSYSGMILAALLINDIKNIRKQQAIVSQLINYGKAITTYYAETLEHIAKLAFDRAVFLGSGPLYGTAMESNLKLQELTDGKVICKYDSYLGFRHGPKAIIDERTLVIYYLSGDTDALRYEKDLIRVC